MSDTPIPPDDGAGQGDEAGEAGADTPWYSRPATWIIGVIILIIALVIILLVANNDDDNDTTTITSTTTASTTTTGSSTTSTPASTTSAAPEATTTSTPADTSTSAAPGPAPVVIEASAVNASLDDYDEPGGPPPFDPTGVEAHWYIWEDYYVVVYGGFDAGAAPAQCPGNSINSGGSFEFVSNSATEAGSCDPEDEYPNIIPIDDDMGTRVCDTLVLYRTIIPLMDDGGAPRTGTLYGTIEAFTDAGFAGATSMVEADYEALTKLDPTADAYTVPDGWLPDGNDVVC